MRTPIRFCLAACAATLGAGCSSSSSDTSPDATVGDDGGSDDGGGGGDIFVILVLFATDDMPVNNASVALDIGTTRYEVTTGSDGLATFTNLTFGEDTAAVTVYRNLYGAVSYVGLEPSDAVLQVRLPRRAPEANPDTVTGIASNMTSDSNPLLVTSTVGLPDDSTLPAPDYVVNVEGDVAGHLVALEYAAVPGAGPRDFWIEHKQWAVKSHPAVTTNAVVDLDFAVDVATPVAVSGTFVLPTRVDSPLRTDSDARITVTSDNPSALLGVIETATLAGSMDTFDVTGRYVVVPETIDPLTSYSLRVPAPLGLTHEVSSVYEFAYPMDGYTIDTFLDSPEVTSGLDLVPMSDEITWTPFATVGRTWLRVTTEDDPPERVWDVFLPEGATTLTLPELPSAAPNSVLGDLPLAGRIFLCDVDETRNLCARVASSRKIELIP